MARKGLKPFIEHKETLVLFTERVLKRAFAGYGRTLAIESEGEDGALNKLIDEPAAFKSRESVIQLQPFSLLRHSIKKMHRKMLIHDIAEQEISFLQRDTLHSQTQSMKKPEIINRAFKHRLTTACLFNTP
jgi:hypothetical protein